jgi:hypothetical protein
MAGEDATACTRIERKRPTGAWHSQMLKADKEGSSNDTLSFLKSGVKKNKNANYYVSPTILTSASGMASPAPSSCTSQTPSWGTSWALITTAALPGVHMLDSLVWVLIGEKCT